jgi:hypothetical protein
MSGSLSTSRRLAGIVSFTVDGESWDVVDGLEYQPDGASRETLKGQSRVEGFSEMPNQGMISATLRDRGDEAVRNLGAKTHATVIAISANGKTVSGFGMWRVGEPPSVKTKDGTFEIKFESDLVTEDTI